MAGWNERERASTVALRFHGGRGRFAELRVTHPVSATPSTQLRAKVRAAGDGLQLAEEMCVCVCVGCQAIVAHGGGMAVL